MTEWDIRSWCWQPGFPVGEHYKLDMSVQSQICTRPDMSLDVARTLNNNKQRELVAQCAAQPTTLVLPFAVRWWVDVLNELLYDTL